MQKYLASFILITLTFFTTSAIAEKSAPDFTLPLDQGSISLSQFRGKVVYVDFWASWCVPCKKSFPWMNTMEREYGNKGLKIITINLDKKKSEVAKFLGRYPASFAVAYDPEGKTAAAYNVKGMPSSYLIDRNGKIIYTHIGFREHNKSELEQRIRMALAS